ncbi:MAG: hypothetical protein FJX19_05365 [Alphaproteobacteria bacterium]|nr:hypothetical protein [Alphaproteobacteria bacterium]
MNLAGAAHVDGAIALLAWADTAEPGAAAVYHIGHLAIDAPVYGPGAPRIVREGPRELADAAWRLAALERVHLVQRRLAPARFAYLAILRPPRSSPDPHRPGASAPSNATPRQDTPPPSPTYGERDALSQQRSAA